MTPPPPNARAIFLHSNVLYNDVEFVTGDRKSAISHKSATSRFEQLTLLCLYVLKEEKDKLKQNFSFPVSRS